MIMNGLNRSLHQNRTQLPTRLLINKWYIPQQHSNVQTLRRFGTGFFIGGGGVGGEGGAGGRERLTTSTRSYTFETPIFMQASPLVYFV